MICYNDWCLCRPADHNCPCESCGARVREDGRTTYTTTTDAKGAKQMEQNGVIARVPAGEAGPLWNCGGEVVKPGLPSADGMITQMGNQVFMAQISALKILKFLTGTEEQTTGQKQRFNPRAVTTTSPNN